MAKKEKPATSIIKALEFVKPICKSKGLIQEQHCKIAWNYVISNNDEMTMGCPIEIDFEAYPQLTQLIAAFKKTGDSLVITNFDDCISVQSDDFEAIVLYCEPGQVEFADPDILDESCQCDSRLIQSLKALAPIAEKKNDNLFKTCVKISDEISIATDGKQLIEYYTGAMIPTLFIPKKSAEIIGKIKKQLSGIGYSEDSVTFWFDDESFVKTKTIDATDIDTSRFFQCENFHEVPENFFESLEKLKPFAINNEVYLTREKIYAGRGDNESNVTIDGLTENMIFNVNYLLNFKNFTMISFDAERTCVEFQNEIARGLVMGIKHNDKE
jgi:hypothetical protein